MCVYPTWISGQYRFRQWNYFDFQGPRTNNNVEGWHSRLKKVVGKPHPNLYEIIDVFKREEASTKVKLLILQAGAQQAPRRNDPHLVDFHLFYVFLSTMSLLHPLFLIHYHVIHFTTLNLPCLFIFYPHCINVLN